ncbi:hypothetical protein ACWKWA_01000 [Dermacoccus abyssi]
MTDQSDLQRPDGLLDDEEMNAQTMAYMRLMGIEEAQAELLARGARRSSPECKRLERAKEAAFKALNAAAEAEYTFEGVPVEYWGHKPTTRIKGCYELTGYVVMKQKVPAGTEMVFGHWQVGQGLEGFDIPHVWLQLPDGRIWEPVSATLDEAEAQIDRHDLREYDHVEKTRFSDKEAIRLMLKYKTVGGDFAQLEVTPRGSAPFR